jgi:hypothetical protein
LENNKLSIEEFEGLPLRYAYGFLTEKGFGKETMEIKQTKSGTSSLKRGMVLDILEKNNLLEEFISKFWRFGNTDGGKKKIRRYKRLLSSFLNNDEAEEETIADNMDETSFAYEEDLRDYLSQNLSIIEAGLALFKDKDGTEGIEYPVDLENKRVDILALDKNQIPVVIELKVSKGYEKVIGQCLYYKNRIKEVLGASKVRVIIIAREITPHLRIATADLTDVELFEYTLAVKIRKV